MHIMRCVISMIVVRISRDDARRHRCHVTFMDARRMDHPARRHHDGEEQNDRTEEARDSFHGALCFKQDQGDFKLFALQILKLP